MKEFFFSLFNSKLQYFCAIFVYQFVHEFEFLPKEKKLVTLQKNSLPNQRTSAHRSKNTGLFETYGKKIVALIHAEGGTLLYERLGLN